MPITVALENSVEDVRPYIEAVAPTHPSLIDTRHVVAELYHAVNVPMQVWIDERGRVVRPADRQFGTDTFTAFHHKRSAPYLDMIRAWVREGAGVLSPEEIRKLQLAPTAETQQARAERALAFHLYERGRGEAAERHLDRAAELAPADWTIRRGGMSLRGQNPFGPEFFALAEEGTPEFPTEAVTPTADPDAS